MAVRSIQRTVPTLAVRTPPSGPGWAVHRTPNGARAYIARDVVLRVRALNGQYRPNEVAGLLIGRRFIHAGRAYVVVSELVEHVPGEIVNGRAHVRIAAEGAYRMEQRALQRQPLGDIVGWWHTHPEFPPYFSGVDRAEQQHWTNPTSVGLVLSGAPADGPEWMVYLGPTSVETHIVDDSAAASPSAERPVAERAPLAPAAPKRFVPRRLVARAPTLIPGLAMVAATAALAAGAEGWAHAGDAAERAAAAESASRAAIHALDALRRGAASDRARLAELERAVARIAGRSRGGASATRPSVHTASRPTIAWPAFPETSADTARGRR